MQIDIPYQFLTSNFKNREFISIYINNFKFFHMNVIVKCLIWIETNYYSHSLCGPAMIKDSSKTFYIRGKEMVVSLWEYEIIQILEGMS